MNIDHFKKLDITLHQDESETMREILRLAYERLHSAPKEQMRGIPVERQAGLVGPELFRVKDMIERLGKATGINLPVEPEEPEEHQVAIIVTIIRERK